MSRQDCKTPLSLPELLAYHQRELKEEEEQRVEEHFFSCELCTRRLETVERLRAGLADLMRQGRVTSSTTAELLDHATRQGLKVRTYRLRAGEQVPCTISPTDDFVAMCFAADLSGVERVDITVEATYLETGAREEQRVEDVAIDRAKGEIVFLYAGDLVRSLPRTRWRMDIRARGPGGERPLGLYTLNHTPWEALPAHE